MAAADAPAEDYSAARRAKAEGRVRASLGQLRADVDARDAKALDDLAQRAVAAESDAGASALCTELRVQVRALNRAAQRRQAHAQDATELLTELDGFDGPDVGVAAAVLRSVQAGQAPLTAEIRRQVRAAAVRGRAEADRTYTAGVLAGVLGELGYDVEVGFETLAGTEGGGYATRWPGYSVKVEVTDAGRMSATMMREGRGPDSRSEQQAELEVERSFCRDIAQATIALESQHVVAELTHQVRAGEEPLAAAEASRTERARLHHQRQQQIRRAAPRTQGQR